MNLTEFLKFLSVGLMGYAIGDYWRLHKNKVEDAEVVSQVELLLKLAKKATIIDPAISEIEDAWSNANYIGPVVKQSFKEWARQTNTLSP